MHRSIKPLVSVVFLIALIALATAPAASALPPQCEFACTCNSRCSQVCAIGSWVVTCDFDQTCRDYCFASAPIQGDQGAKVAPSSEETGVCTSPQAATPAPDLALPPAEGAPNATVPLVK